nr:MAG TPA: hypothetical protein [Bacteriophage sp.]
MPLTNNQYVPAQWVEDNAPPISASELQAMSDAIRGVNNFVTCTTDGATTEKEVTISGFTLMVGSRVCVTFTNAWTTAAAKLTVIGAAATYGPTPVRYAGSETLLSGIVPANYPAIFQYDGTAWNLINPTHVFLFSASASASGWTENKTSGLFTQNVSVSGLLGSDAPIADVVMGDTAESIEATAKAWALIARIDVSDGACTLYATEQPSVDFSFQLKVVR